MLWRQRLFLSHFYIVKVKRFSIHKRSYRSTCCINICYLFLLCSVYLFSISISSSLWSVSTLHVLLVIVFIVHCLNYLMFPDSESWERNIGLSNSISRSQATFLGHWQARGLLAFGSYFQFQSNQQCSGSVWVGTACRMLLFTRMRSQWAWWLIFEHKLQRQKLINLLSHLRPGFPKSCSWRQLKFILESSVYRCVRFTLPLRRINTSYNLSHLHSILKCKRRFASFCIYTSSNNGRYCFYLTNKKTGSGR
jgi:hypothetical protein